MAMNYVNTGSSANKGDGDNLRTAFWKVNSNLSQLYDAVVTTATIQNTIGALLVNGIQNGLTVTYSTSTAVVDFSLNTATVNNIGGVSLGSGLDATADGRLSVNKNYIYQNINNNLVPELSEIYSLGASTTNSWYTAYVSTAGIYIGEKSLTINSIDQLVIDGNILDTAKIVSTTSSYSIENITEAEPAVITVVNSILLSTGDRIYIDGVEGMTTINQNTYYIRVLDSHNAELYVDSELITPVNSIGYPPYNTGTGVAYYSNDVTISVNAGIPRVWTFDYTGALTIPGSIIASDGNVDLFSGDTAGSAAIIWQNSEGGNDPSEYGIRFSKVQADSAGARVYAEGSDTNYTWLFGNSGKLTFPDGTQIGVLEGAGTFGLYNANTSTEFLLEAGNKVWSFGGEYSTITVPDGSSLIHNGLMIGSEGTDAYIDIPNNANSNIYGGLRIGNDGGPITILANSNSWEFDAQGNLTSPQDGAIGSEGMGAFGLSNGTSGNPVYIVNKKTNGDYLANIILTAGDGISGEITFEIWNTQTASTKTLSINTASNLVFNDGTIYEGAEISVPYATSGSFKITTIDDNFGMGPYEPKTFEVRGSRIILPTGNGTIDVGGEIWQLNSGGQYFSFPNGAQLEYGIGIDGLSTGSLQISVYDLELIGSPPEVSINLNDSNKQWWFRNNGALEFPDNTQQATAYRFVTPPESSTSTGIAGALAQDTTYFYVCTATNAWQRIAWDNTSW